MSFDTKPGTHGARQPRGALAKLGNRMMARRIGRRPGVKVMGFDALVLTTIGRKSGAERMTPVGRFPGKDGSWLIVASAAGGPSNPDWYNNLATHPDQVRITVDGETFDVRAEQLHGAERDEAWQQVTTIAPRFAQYQVKTDREIPVIRLVKRG